MALSEERILDAAIEVLNAYGLASTSMRQIAKEIGVQPNSIYWYIKSKQELLAKIAERILNSSDQHSQASPNTPQLAAAQIHRLLLEFRANMLSIRDGAEIVSLAQALQHAPLQPTQQITELLATSTDQRAAEWGARALVHYALGLVAGEQNQGELRRAGILDSAEPESETATEFSFGVQTILRGLGLPAEQD
ncbi:TetR/AcrR family transcriptional regulator [Psychromicrobium lacuslunae]|uniref:HTH tetR-type domain-containing protein n=1 Tax=Psychromicrobium lacuslunae TaxID=1618207 RepID=A0A0D4C0A6_9MICC|nr:TetR family transcriptional regulator [Psychromicrobium lacuslunae]AJT41796.1 hypothetical protein UM93_10185 [Psychromicrobium lacuslunae]